MQHEKLSEQYSRPMVGHGLTYRGRRRVAVLLGPFIGLAILLACGVAFFAHYAPAQAACGGNTPVGNETALNNAISDFNSQAGPCVYTITLTANIPLLSSTTPIANANADVELIIEGAGYAVDGQNGAGVRPFEIGEGSDVTMRNLTISGGHPFSGGGGGILNSGILTVTHSTISANAAGFNGGGIFNDGLLFVDSSTFDGNSASDVNSWGGAIYGSIYSYMAITNTTFSFNSAGYGGAIMLYNTEPITISNSTFSGNSAARRGGGLLNENSQLTLINTTLSGNSALDAGGGIATGFLVCFTADMQVQMADGSSKRIADVEVGDQVLSYDFTLGRKVVTTVQATLQRPADEYYRLNGIEVTPEHPFAVGHDAWRKARELQIGDRVLTADGWTTITSKTLVRERVDVYNLNVDGPHNYYVTTGEEGDGGYLVHNKNIDLDDNQTLVQNSIITNSRGGDCYGGDGTASYLGSNNLIDDHASGDCSAISDAAVTNFDGDLQPHGGPTLTHALFADSNALDSGENSLALAPDKSPLTTDQRGPGFPRVANGIVDIGAFEGFIESASPLFMTAAGPGTTGNGINFGKEDILEIVELGSGAWALFFDGTAAGLTAKHDINAIHVNTADDIYLSFFQNKIKTTSLGNIFGQDILHYDGSSFSLFFDGSDVGLTTTAEKIDALHILDGSLAPFDGCDHYLLVSTLGTGKVPAAGGGQLKFQGEDVLGFCLVNSGADTAGFWNMVLDGSEVGMSKNSTDSISASADGQTFYLTTKGPFNLDDASGGHSVVYKTDGTFSGPHFSAPANGLNQKVDGLHVEGNLP